MDPVTFRAWVRNFRDIVITIIAAFILIYEAVFRATPNTLLVGAGMTLLGLPVAFRLDQLFRYEEDGSGDRPGRGRNS